MALNHEPNSNRDNLNSDNDGLTERSIDLLVVAQAAAAGVMISVPAAFINGVLAASGDRSAVLSLVTVIGVVIGFFLASAVGAYYAERNENTHGLFASLMVLMLTESVLILGRLERDQPISLPVILLTGAMAVGVGSLGASFGMKRKTAKAKK